ncbi:uncharacterized protein LOC126910710 [Spodoptera frugiperda]|uniref:Uncharacterized protein LOC126910710 n=1 Tax=Spodoptera frugiperda TaxID=7108 RepID=A0A9R0EUD3_SPOFR|nr:uncharacterized protein LOC126910710 [Spodoptera frugiperda]
MSERLGFVRCLIILSMYYWACVSEKITYISVEHPKVDYMNTKYLVYANLTAERFSRSNPVYYVGLHFHHLIPWGSNIYIDVYFYELLSNQYKRSFVEMHFDWCYLVEKDLFFGAAVRAGGWKGGCPHGPGKVNLYNMTINPAYIPRGFPFTKGRIYANFSLTKTKERVAEGHIDMRIATVEAKSIKSLF